MADSDDDSFPGAVKRLSEASRQLGSASAALERMARDAMLPAARASTPAWGGSGGGGGRATTPEGEPDNPGLLGRLAQRSRYGAAYDRWESKARDLFGTGARGGDGEGSGGSAANALGKLGRGGGGGAKAGAAAAEAGGMAGMAGMATKLAGPVGVAIEAGKALYEFKKAVEQSTAAQLESYRKLAEVSGAMSVVIANRDLRDTLRDMKRGNDLASSAGALADSEARRKDATLPVENAIEKATNSILAVLNDSIAIAANQVNDILELLKKAFPGLLVDPAAAPIGPLEMAITRRGGVLDDALAAELRGRNLIANLKAADAGIGGGAAPGGIGGARPGRLP